MVEESGQVVAITDEGVWVETIRQSACGSCSSAKGCGQKMLATVGQGQRFEVLAENPRQLIIDVGDRVILGLAESAFLKASLLAYLLPLLALMAAALLAESLGQTEGFIAVAGVLGLVLGLVAMKYIAQRQASRAQFRPEILRTDQTVI